MGFKIKSAMNVVIKGIKAKYPVERFCNKRMFYKSIQATPKTKSATSPKSAVFDPFIFSGCSLMKVNNNKRAKMLKQKTSHNVLPFSKVKAKKGAIVIKAVATKG